jgi:hypothetical protein
LSTHIAYRLKLFVREVAKFKVMELRGGREKERTVEVREKQSRSGREKEGSGEMEKSGEESRGRDEERRQSSGEEEGRERTKALGVIFIDYNVAT